MPDHLRAELRRSGLREGTGCEADTGHGQGKNAGHVADQSPRGPAVFPRRHSRLPIICLAFDRRRTKGNPKLAGRVEAATKGWRGLEAARTFGTTLPAK